MLSLGGCSVVQDKQREIHLENTLKIYQKALRWGDFETVLALYHPQPAPLDTALLARLKNIKITRYTETQHYSPSTTEYYQKIELHYYQPPGITEKHHSYHQLWRYDETTQRWYIDGDPPALW